jgi:hypothetical protein
VPKATKEFVLNYAMNRWQLNFKKNVGPTSDSIRECNPSSFEEWKNYYYNHVRSSEHIDKLGHLLYSHISNDLPGEERFHPMLIDSITEEDCVHYMHMVVLERTFNGFMKEHGQL